MALLEVKDLKVRVEEREILHGLTLTVNEGEVHAIMGPNGSGKSTLSHVIAGKPGYEVTGGQVLFKGEDLLEMSADQRAAIPSTPHRTLSESASNQTPISAPVMTAVYVHRWPALSPARR